MGQERESIISCKPEKLIRFADPERVVLRKILGWSASCGSIGPDGRSGSPGFFGLHLDKRGQFPREWLILTLWNASAWLELDGKWISAHPEQYGIQRPLYSNFAGLQHWNEVTPKLSGKVLRKFEVRKTHALLEIGTEIDSVTIRLHEDPTRRPVIVGNGKLRTLKRNENLRNAWIVSPTSLVEI